jgi:alanine-synthesizing transaminase
VDGLNRIGWPCEKPKGTMFVWAKIPKAMAQMGSLEFCKHALKEAKVALSPGIGFGHHGEGYIRFALVENQKRTKQALQGLKKVL